MKPDEPLDIQKIVEFLGWTFGIAWISALIVYLAGIEYGTLTSIVLITIFFMWAPAISAIIVQNWRGESIRTACGLVWGRWGWIAIAWLTPVAIIGLTIGVGLLFPGVNFTSNYGAFLLDMGLPPEQVDVALTELEALPVPPGVLILLQGLIAGLTINALAALGEELGWRGLLLTELSPLGFWKVSVITGFVWGIWHAPVILQGHNFPEAPVVGVAVMTMATMAMAPIYTYLTVRAQSVVAPTFLHGTFNAIGALSLVYLTGAGNIVTSPVGLAGIGAALLVVGTCLAHDRWVADEPITTGAPLSPWPERVHSEGSGKVGPDSG